MELVMKVYQELNIRGGREALQSFLAELDHTLAEGWTRDRDQEAQVLSGLYGRMYCYTCSDRPRRPPSQLWIVWNRDQSLKVSNILAAQYTLLNPDQYNAILADFFRVCVEPAAKRISAVTLELGESEVRIEDFLSARTAQLLRAFSGSANKGNLHPYDQKRWYEFISAAYREGSTLSSALLERWLAEEEHWPEDSARSLAAEYESSKELLQVFQAS
jgi:hypothetical protein